ncbi:adenylate/guanylate cyclase domain-containing protein [Mycolicibacterium cosmeticum]|uniref:Adenylate and guanylate cyclase catalytic domain-containing protein n=1 Tax=Mycolicibacterium cosmeticum TaxID=258533 RepID=W9ALA3_MYCCO|nr:adenylate/guanylate cyclase domain-containing protein [Mycolicibacterium cosmeticum]TLH71166.1 adenylate/guanylate cyclase domain-containing protein [Mycolicibacterium cosmeticum]CDO06489.1 adenylate and guanylate cyclase catalytic domain-containing protein [Mycolicibacterium cosmeticum]
MVDFDALEAAGIADARRRAPLIEYLDGLGFTADQMVEAEARGRLFGLAGDVLQWSGPPEYCLADAAAEIGVSLADVEHAWAALGLTVTDCSTKSLSRADVEALRTWAEMRLVVGDVAATGLLRVIGSGMARLAEAESSMMRATSPDVQIEVSHDEFATARAYREAVSYLPRIGAAIDAVHRQHLMSARTYFEHVVRDASPTVVCGIGFADLSGFTALTQLLSAAELTDLLNDFGATAADVVHAANGRVVKFIGDAVMWVSSTPELLMDAAIALVGNTKAREAGLRVRAGLGYGEVLAISGDYFGNPVNLAARLVATAEPGQILVSSALYDELSGHDFAPSRSFTLKGFDAPVTAHPLLCL